MSNPKTFALAAASLVTLIVGVAWFVAHEVNEALREYAELGETMGVPFHEVEQHLMER